MLKITPRITIDALTRIPHLTLVVLDSPESKQAPKIGDVWGVKGSPAHTPVHSLEGAFALYESYRLFLTTLPALALVEARLRFQFTQAQTELSQRSREASAVIAA